MAVPLRALADLRTLHTTAADTFWLPPALPFHGWLRQFQGEWRQGEHVALIGMTGSGKTTLAGEILPARDFVVNLAVKRNDDTLAGFQPRFKLIKKWPPAYDEHKVILWSKPHGLKAEHVLSQADEVHEILNHCFLDGGWCVYLDDTGYVSGNLGLSRAIAMLLSQGRSSGLSIVTAMTQPTSVAQRVPSEVFRQVQHIFAFRYRNDKDIRSIAEMTGYDWQDMKGYMRLLGPRDFLAFSHGDVTLVRAAQLR